MLEVVYTYNRGITFAEGRASQVMSETWYDQYSNTVAGLSVANTLVETAASRTAYDLRNAKYAVRGQNLAKQAAQMTKFAARLNIAGGVLGVADNSIQAYNDFSNGNYLRGSVQAGQAGAYATGLVFIAIPGGQVIGGAIILGAGITDLIEWGFGW
jgi:hypothetical protein